MELVCLKCRALNAKRRGKRGRASAVFPRGALARNFNAG
jgi:hypothetical protein